MVYDLRKTIVQGTLVVSLGLILLYTITPEARGIDKWDCSCPMRYPTMYNSWIAGSVFAAWSGAAMAEAAAAHAITIRKCITLAAALINLPPKTEETTKKTEQLYKVLRGEGQKKD